jgi:hypothetical protein
MPTTTPIPAAPRLRVAHAALVDAAAQYLAAGAASTHDATDAECFRALVESGNHTISTRLLELADQVAEIAGLPR